MKDHLSDILKFPAKPGVYIMRNKAGGILYIGKAKNLKARVRQYFAPGGDSRSMIPFLTAKVETIDTLVVNSEKEALLLENNLIKQHKPPYNVFFKDDKTYIALKINNKHAWPTVQIVRYRGRPKADGLYFGPYTSAFAARTTLELIHKLFPLRQCSDQELQRRTRPCILYDMKRCIAPCVNYCTKEEYMHFVNDVTRFLRGYNREVLKDLQEQMQQWSDKLEFEKAQEIYQIIAQIEKTLEQQNVDKPLGKDLDVIALYREGDEVSLSQLIYRAGKLIGSYHYNFINMIHDDAEVYKSFLLQLYETGADVPQEIILPMELEEAELIEEILNANQSRQVTLLSPKKGSKRALIDMAFANAEATFKREKDEQTILENTLLQMQEKFRLTQYPGRIECFDNSNISGTNPVSVMVAFTDGRPDKNRYRKYQIKTISTPDDYATMHEVLTRRYKRGKEENDLPDLLVIDGGKGHLNIALKVLKELNIISIDVISLAKEGGRHDKGMTQELVFLQDIKDPVRLNKTSPLLFLLQKIRDEAHRFAITYHRKKRSASTFKSALDDLPGIGPVKKKTILKHFGSLKQLQQASESDLKQVKGLSKSNIETLLAFIAKKS